LAEGTLKKESDMRLKSKRLFFIIGIPVIALVLAFALKLVRVERGEFNRIEIWYVAEFGKWNVYNILYTPKHRLAKFSKLKIGMYPDDVYKLVGKPTASRGTGIPWEGYKLDNGWYINLRFGNAGKLSRIEIVDYHNDRTFELEQGVQSCGALQEHSTQLEDNE